MTAFPSFEAYVEAEHGGWAKGGQCGGCCRNAPRLTAGIQRGEHRVGAGDCERCIRYMFGYDQGEAQAVHALIYGAVREALKAEIPMPLIRRAVDEAFTDDRDSEAEKWAASKVEAV